MSRTTEAGRQPIDAARELAAEIAAVRQALGRLRQSALRLRNERIGFPGARRRKANHDLWTVLEEVVLYTDSHEVSWLGDLVDTVASVLRGERERVAKICNEYADACDAALLADDGSDASWRMRSQGAAAGARELAKRIRRIGS